MAAKFIETSINVEGLKQLRRVLKDAGPEATKQLKVANVAVADNIVAKATTRAQGLGGIAAKVVGLGALKSANSAVASSVNLRDRLQGPSGKGATFGAEFGSQQHSQFRAWSGNDSGAGYFLYPTIRDEVEKTEQLYGDAIDKLVKSLDGPGR